MDSTPAGASALLRTESRPSLNDAGHLKSGPPSFIGISNTKLRRDPSPMGVLDPQWAPLTLRADTQSVSSSGLSRWSH